MSYKNLVTLATQKEISQEDWLLLTKYIARNMSGLLIKFSLQSLGDQCALNNGYGSWSLRDNVNKLSIDAKGITLQTQGIFGDLFFDSFVPDRSESRTRFKFGYTKSNEWLLISVTYHESAEDARYEAFLESITIHHASLADLLEITPYPYAIWHRLREVVRDWQQSSTKRAVEVSRVESECDFIDTLMTAIK